MNQLPIIPFDFLKKQYIDLKKNVSIIHKEFNISKRRLYKYLRLYKLIKKQKEACKLIYHKVNCLCYFCKAKRGEYKGSNNSMFGVRSPSYIDGRTLKKYYCKCGKEIGYTSKKCASCAQKGKPKPKGFGRKVSFMLKKRWKNKDFYQKMLQIRKQQMTEKVRNKICKTLQKRGITSLEIKLLNIIERYKLPFKYVGNGAFILHGFNPDFINYNGKKQIIEVFYEYFKDKQYGSVEKYKKQRFAIFRSYGFNTLFIGNKDLQSLTERGIVNKIAKFSQEEKS